MSNQTEQVTFSEAPASVTVKTISPAGYDILLTIKDADTSALMGRMKAALSWLEQNGYRPTGNGYAPTPNGNGSAPVCPTHKRPMKRSKHFSGWFCPVKVASDGGDGKPVYCKQRIED